MCALLRIFIPKATRRIGYRIALKLNLCWPYIIQMVALRTIRNVQWVWILRVCPLRAIVHPLSAEGYRRRTSANLLAALVALSTIGAQAHIRWDLATGIQAPQKGNAGEIHYFAAGDMNISVILRNDKVKSILYRKVSGEAFSCDETARGSLAFEPLSLLLVRFRNRYVLVGHANAGKSSRFFCRTRCQSSENPVYEVRDPRGRNDGLPGRGCCWTASATEPSRPCGRTKNGGSPHALRSTGTTSRS